MIREAYNSWMKGSKNLHKESIRKWNCTGKEAACQYRRCKRCGFDPWVGKIPWRRAWQPTPVFWPGESRQEKPGGLQSIESQRVGHDWEAT